MVVELNAKGVGPEDLSVCARPQTSCFSVRKQFRSLMSSATVLRKAICPCCMARKVDSHVWLAHLLHHRVSQQTKHLIFYPDAADRVTADEGNFFPLLMVLCHLLHRSVELETLLFATFEVPFKEVSWKNDESGSVLPCVTRKLVLKNCWVWFDEPGTEMSKREIEDDLVCGAGRSHDSIYAFKAGRDNYAHMLDVFASFCKEISLSERLEIQQKLGNFQDRQACLTTATRILRHMEPAYSNEIVSLADLDTRVFRNSTMVLLERLVKLCVRASALPPAEDDGTSGSNSDSDSDDNDGPVGSDSDTDEVDVASDTVYSPSYHDDPFD